MYSENENRRLSVCFSKGSEFKDHNETLQAKLNQVLEEKAKVIEGAESFKLSTDVLVFLFFFHPFFLPLIWLTVLSLII